MAFLKYPMDMFMLFWGRYGWGDRRIISVTRFLPQAASYIGVTSVNMASWAFWPDMASVRRSRRGNSPGIRGRRPGMSVAAALSRLLSGDREEGLVLFQCFPHPLGLLLGKAVF